MNVNLFLQQNADEELKSFNKRLITTSHPMYGVKLPTLRKFAKQISCQDVSLTQPSYEEILLYGFAAANLKTESLQLEKLKEILPYIDNWALCDCIVCSLKKLCQEESYKFFTDLLSSTKEFYVRVGIVGLMRGFIKTQKLAEIFENLANVKHQGYYVKMAIAWFNAEAAIYNFDLAKQQIQNTTDKFIRNKSISKARESYRINPHQKEELKLLKI